MQKLRLAAIGALLFTLPSCSSILGNMDAFKGLAGQVATVVTGLGATAESVGMGGTVLSQAKSAIESATGTLSGLHGKMTALAKPDEAIRKMLSDTLSAPIQKTTQSLTGAAQREPELASTTGGAVDVLKKFTGLFNM